MSAIHDKTGIKVFGSITVHKDLKGILDVINLNFLNDKYRTIMTIYDFSSTLIVRDVKLEVDNIFSS